MADSLTDLEAMLIVARSLHTDDYLRQKAEQRDAIERAQQDVAALRFLEQQSYERHHARLMDAEDLITKRLNNDFLRIRNAEAQFRADTVRQAFFERRKQQIRLATEEEEKRRLDDLEDYESDGEEDEEEAW